MATATRGRTAAKKAAPAKPAPPVEPEEELEDEEFEEIEEAEEVEAPSAKKSRGGAAAGVTFGVSNLAEHLSKKTGKEVTTRELRALIRRMARDDSGRVQREIVAGNRSRYDWPLGLKDPEVVAIIAAYMGGEGDVEKKEKLAALKEKNDAARAAKAQTTKPVAKKAVAKKAPVVQEADEDDELDFGEE